MPPSSLESWVKSLAREAGFHLVGFSAPRVAPEIERALAAWTARGFEGDMGYMRRPSPRRAHPEDLLPGVRTVICLGLNYYQPTPPKPPGPHGRVAVYARGRDYHRVMDRMLRRFTAELTDRAGARAASKSYADTGPLLERAFAAQAGLGFVGKNTNLLSRLYGSWFFLALVLTDLELQPDRPEAVSCGTCRRCLDACPTNAFAAPYVLDATKCLSYHTIESRAPLPAAVADRMQDWLFGCDVCQEVCPFTKFAQPTPVPEFQPDRGVGAWVPLHEVAALPDDRAFEDRFRGTPLMRAKRSGLQRSAHALLDREAAGALS